MNYSYSVLQTTAPVLFACRFCLLRYKTGIRYAYGYARLLGHMAGIIWHDDGVAWRGKHDGCIRKDFILHSYLSTISLKTVLLWQGMVQLRDKWLEIFKLIFTVLFWVSSRLVSDQSLVWRHKSHFEVFPLSQSLLLHSTQRITGSTKSACLSESSLCCKAKGNFFSETLSQLCSNVDGVSFE